MKVRSRTRRSSRATWHRLVVAILCLIGGVCGTTAALLQAPIYTAETRLSVGRSTLSANMIPGYVSATQDLAANYARFVTTGSIRPVLPEKIADAVKTVSASPIAESNILRIEATAIDPSAAVTAAQIAARGLTQEVESLSSEESAKTALSRYAKISREVSATQQKVQEAQGKVASLRPGGGNASSPSKKLLSAQSDVVTYSTQLLTLQAQQNALGAQYVNLSNTNNAQAELTIVGAASVTGDDTASRLELYLLIGLGVGGGIGLIINRTRGDLFIHSTEEMNMARTDSGEHVDLTTSPMPDDHSFPTPRSGQLSPPTASALPGGSEWAPRRR